MYATGGCAPLKYGVVGANGLEYTTGACALLKGFALEACACISGTAPVASDPDVITVSGTATAASVVVASGEGTYAPVADALSEVVAIACSDPSVDVSGVASGEGSSARLEVAVAP